MICLFTVDVPLEFSCRLRPAACAVDPNLVAYVIPGIPTRDHRTFVWQVQKKRMYKRHQKENLKSTLSSQKKRVKEKVWLYVRFLMAVVQIYQLPTIFAKGEKIMFRRRTPLLSTAPWDFVLHTRIEGKKCVDAFTFSSHACLEDFLPLYSIYEGFFPLKQNSDGILSSIDYAMNCNFSNNP